MQILTLAKLVLRLCGTPRYLCKDTSIYVLYWYKSAHTDARETCGSAVAAKFSEKKVCIDKLYDGFALQQAGTS